MKHVKFATSENGPLGGPPEDDKSHFDSDAEVAALPAPLDRPSIEYWHKQTPGFGVRVMRANKATGEVHRMYIVRYDTSTQRNVKRNIGRAWVAASSREKARAAVGKLRFQDAEHRARTIREVEEHKRATGTEQRPTLAQAFEAYVKDKGAGLRPATVESYRKRLLLCYRRPADQVGRTFETYLDPLTKLRATRQKDPNRFDQEVFDVANQNIMNLTSPQLWRDYYDAVVEAAGISSAVSTCRVLHAVFEHLVDHDKLTRNPLQQLMKSGQYGAVDHDTAVRREKLRRPLIIKKADLRAVWDWAHSRPLPVVRDYIIASLLLGFRSAMVGSMRWEYLDIDSGLYEVLPEQRGNKAGVRFMFPLPVWLVENVLRPRFASKRPDDEWIFPSPKRAGTPLHSVRGSLQRMHKDTGVLIAPHGFRRTLASVAHGVGVSGKELSMLLTHSVKVTPREIIAVSAGYVTVEMADLKLMVNKVAGAVLKECGVAVEAV